MFNFMKFYITFHMVDVQLAIQDETSVQFDHGSGIFRTSAAPCACAGGWVCVIFFRVK